MRKAIELKYHCWLKFNKCFHLKRTRVYKLIIVRWLKECDSGQCANFRPKIAGQQLHFPPHCSHCPVFTIPPGLLLSSPPSPHHFPVPSGLISKPSTSPPLSSSIKSAVYCPAHLPLSNSPRSAAVQPTFSPSLSSSIRTDFQTLLLTIPFQFHQD